MRMRESLKGEYCYKKADSAGERGDGAKQPFKECKTSYLRTRAVRQDKRRSEEGVISWQQQDAVIQEEDRRMGEEGIWSHRRMYMEVWRPNRK